MEDKKASIVDSRKDPIALSLFLLEDNPGIIKCEQNLYLYNGKCYDLIEQDEIMEMLHKFLMTYGITSAWSKRNDIIQSLRSYSKIPSVDKMNDYDDLMCVDNGILNILTKELIPHSQDYYFDSIINVEYSKDDTDCPVFLKYLKHTFSGEEDTVENAIMLGGYLLDSSCAAERMFIFNGSGGNGKSILIDTFSMFFSDATMRPQITSISLGDLASDKFKKFDLVTSRVNLSSEEKKGYIDSEEIKKIISGELINVRGLYRDTITFRPKTKLVVAVNNLFKFTDTSDGTARRLIIFNFLNQYKSPDEIRHIKYAEQKRIFPWDLDLPKKIKEERAAILNLFIDGLVKLRKRKYQFIISDTFTKAMKEFRRDNDTVREFLEDHYDIDPDATAESGGLPVIDVYNHYRWWYRDNVQDSQAFKFRANEMGRRIKEILGVSDCGRRNIRNEDTGDYERLTIYPVRRVFLDEYGNPENEQLKQVKATFGGEIYEE